MGKRIDGAKLWFEHHKIFFEILSMAFIAFASLIVSFFSWKTNEAQLEVSQAGLAPNFYTEAQLIFNPVDKNYDEDVLKIINSGGAVHNVLMDLKTFIKVRVADRESTRFVFVPINGYYSSIFASTAPTGVLQTYTGFNNNKKYAALYRSLLSLTKEKIDRDSDQAYYEINLVKMVKISYFDRLNRNQVEYMMDSDKVDSEIAEKIFTTALIGPLLDIDSVTISDIIDRAKNDNALYREILKKY